MDINRFTQKSQEALAAAQSLAARYQNQQIDVEHLLFALLEEEGLAAPLFEKSGINPRLIRSRLQQELERLPRVTGPSGAPDQI
jgi:ATP-dependent Clp protease ATP-binding subunit ClpB